MSFWPLRRRRGDPESPPKEGEESVVNRLAVVELWTADERVTVGVDLGGARVTDLLNGDPTLKVVHFDPPPDEGTAWVELRPDQTWLDVDVENVLLAFPPPQPTNPRRRLHRPRQAIELRISPFEVYGTVHIPPGAQAVGFLFRQSARFEPVTRASVRDSRAELFERRAEVVLVNLRRVESMHDLGLEDTREGEPAAAAEDEEPMPEEPLPDPPG